MSLDSIIVRGAREHNLKNIDVVIPRDKLVVITGVSGSGKSSLAFDTIYAEGQRRYVESLSAYARQFLGRMEKPEVDYIAGLSPAISIDQKGVSKNPRSTMGTMTETYDYLRLLFARVGHPHCPRCGREIASQTVEQIVDAIQGIPEGSRIMIMAPLIKDRKGEYQAVFEDLRKAGYARVRIDGNIRELSEEFQLDKNKKHSIEVVVDRLVVGQGGSQGRIADSVETALKLGAGVVLVSVIDGEELLFSEHFACVYCGISLGEIAPRTFSFNSPHGACPACTGLGVKLAIDPEIIIPNKELSIAEGAIHPGWWFSWHAHELELLGKRYGFSVRTPVRDLSEQHLKLILYGEEGKWAKYRSRFGRVREHFSGYEGVIPYLERLSRDTQSERTRAEIERYMMSTPCPVCQGQRLKPESLAVTIDGKNIVEVSAMSVAQALEWVADLGGDGRRVILSERERTIAHQVLKEIQARLGFLRDVGLSYLTLDRPSATLAGGEAQRIRLATQIGSGLMGVLYICDEPTVGLHPADGSRLIETLKRLRDLGNTMLIVEHDEAMMRAADHIIDMGPGAGERGGKIVATGTITDIMKSKDSITGQYLSGVKKIALPQKRRPGSGEEIIVKGARQNNLKNIDVSIPLGKFVCITGVSGSGKSTLINEILFKKLAQTLYRSRERAGDCDGILGIEHIDKVVNIDQSPIGRTPRSNPATYTGTFTPIRELFATVPEARMRGYAPGRFSFNVKGGRCEACGGEGFIQIEMQFLPDVTVPCEVCQGKRYNREALEIKFRDKNIAEVLDMAVEQAVSFFEHFPRVKAKLETLRDVGLGYIRLGQPAPTLSGGEAQRVKLATELSKRSTGRTLYILDEPTTGLSFEDVAALLRVLQRLVDSGNTVVVIEHHLDVIKNADYIIDLGPGAGDEGGSIVTVGTPEEVARGKSSATGEYLRPVLARNAEYALT
ncbi:MAG: excinuclease ABC subunit UvrA [Dehalococcoidales bacterium]|nr:excinuclease ABC subunit UvrA [Dehalococcoidales bacterium]MDZ4230483.1 excinuclease ABC subunit UvrA [Dehalococcoidales bacterium]